MRRFLGFLVLILVLSYSSKYVEALRLELLGNYAEAGKLYEEIES